MGGTLLPEETPGGGVTMVLSVPAADAERNGAAGHPAGGGAQEASGPGAGEAAGTGTKAQEVAR
jgi:two-component system sensor histidine kinase KdpD